MTADVILRYDGNNLKYCWWNGWTFVDIGPSAIVVGDQKTHDIMLCINPSAITVFEDGDLKGVWNTAVPATFQPQFHWQILAPGATLDATLSDIIVLPPLFVPNVRTPWDVAFSNVGVSSNQWSIGQSDGDPLPVSFSTDGYMRISTDKLSKVNSWRFTSSTFSLPPSGVLMYRMRVNSSGGSETKVTVFGDYILRITNGGQHVEWDVYLSDLQFHKQGDSTIKVGSPDWTVVMIHYSTTTATLFENGVKMFSSPWRTGSPDLHTIPFHVQHLDTNTAVSVDISHVRTGTVCKSQMNLVQDLQPSLVNYYPLKRDATDAVLGTASSDLVPTSGYDPTYSTGDFGNAITFSDGIGALRIPPYPYGNYFASYTVSAFTKLTSYPSGSDNAGIVGQLAIRPDGKLEFIFIYAGKQSYITPKASFVSNNKVPLNTWTSIIVTYSYEESRLSFYIGGVLDSVFYTSSDNSSQFAVNPMNGFVGAALSITRPGCDRMTVLSGQISDVMLLKTHIHSSIAAAMASSVDESNVHQLTLSSPHPDVVDSESHEAFVIFLAIPLVATLIIAVAGNAYIYNQIDESSPTPHPSLDQIVQNIRNKVGDPAPANPHKCTREEAGIPSNFPIMLDIGGEGPFVGGYSAGFKDAINVNDTDLQSSPDISRQPFKQWPIPYLVKLESWARDPTYPFADNFAERMVMQSAPMTAKNVEEFARVIKPGGE